MNLHPFLPTIVAFKGVPEGAMYAVPNIELINIYSPNGELIAQNFEFERKQCFVITGIGSQKE